VFNVTTPYPGTRMFEWARRNGYLRTLDWSEYDLANSVMELPTVSTEELNRLYRVAYREFYFRPGYLLRRLLRMRSFEDIKMNLQALRSIMFVRDTAPRPEACKRTPDRSVGHFAPTTASTTVEVCT